MRVTPEGILARATDFAPGGGPGRLLGFAARETTGAAGAGFQVIDGQDAQGALVVPVNLSANESTREWYGPHGIDLELAPFLHMLSGTVDFVFYVAYDSDPENQG